MTVIVNGGAADGSDLLNYFYWWNNTKGSGIGTHARISIGNKYASLIIHKPPPPPPPVPRTDPIYAAWAKTPQAAPQVVAVFQSYIPGVVGATGNLSSLFTAGKGCVVCGNGGFFLAVEYGSGIVAKSLDCVTWTVVNSGIASAVNYNGGLVWTGSMFVLSGQGGPGSGKITVTADGVTWTNKPVPDKPSGGSAWTIGPPATDGAGNVVIIGPYTLIVSTDGGNTWSTIAPAIAALVPQYLTYTGTEFIVYANTHNGTSLNGMAWTNVSASGGANVENMAGNGSNVCLPAYGTCDHVIRTTDGGATWGTAALPVTPIDPFIAYGAGIFVLVSEPNSASNLYMTSADNGATWTPLSLPVSKIWKSLAFTDGIFVLSASDGSVWLSGTPSTPASWTDIGANLPDIYITQADIDAFNTLHAGEGVTAEMGRLSAPGAGAFGIQFLAGGSLCETTSCPQVFSLSGSFNELTAPPLPFSAGGSMVDHASSVTLPIPNMATGGIIEHIGVPFALGG